MPSYCFSSPELQMFLMSSHVLKQLDYMMIFYFYLVCFTFSISYLVLPFHLVYVLQFLHLFFVNVRSQSFIKCNRKLSYTNICISSFQFSHSVVSDSLQPHGLKHARPPCPSQIRSSLKLMSIESVMPSNHLILCHPLLLLPSIFPSIRVFSNESTLRTRWPKY